MSMLEKIVVASDNFVREMQSYQDCYVWLNFNGRENFVQYIYEKESFDIFGFLPKGLSFFDQHAAIKILKFFREDPKQRACILSQETVNSESAVFLNCTLVGYGPIDLNKIIENRDWETVKIKRLVKLLDG